MTTMSIEGTSVELDPEGYFASPDEWTEAMAPTLAQQAGIDLSDDHWRVIRFAREDFAETGRTPGLRRISLRTGIPIKQLYALFPKGPAKLIARIAGLPKPKSCL